MQFGKPIGSFQMIQEMIVDMVAETEASRLLAYRALDLLDKGQKCRWQSSLAKAYATEAAVRTTSKAIQVHGAMGLSDEYPVERYFRDARTLTIPDGTTQMQKLIVGRDITGIRAMAGL
jgi:alkylation response protein AidB-like acyl-CoA dehydrogenase